MNILYVCADPGIPIRGTKGAAVHVRALINAFAELGHRITLMTPRAGSDPAVLNARLVEVPHGSASADREARAREIANAVHQASLQELGREKYDFIYERYSLWSDAGARLAQSSGLPLIVEVNAPLRLEAARYRALDQTDLAAEIEKSTFGAAHAIAVVSNPLREYVIAQGTRAEAVHVLPNAVDENIFHPAVDGGTLRARLGLKEKFVIGFVGTLKPWHDLDTLIAALRRLCAPATHAYHLLLVGNIPDAVRAEIAQSLPNAATIIGPIPHDDVPAYIAAMDVAVSPHPPLDGFYFSPLKLFEYLACGVATIAADVPPIREVVADGETGCLYPPGDAPALAQKIEMLARDKSLRARVAWAGARRVLTEHTWKRNAEKIIHLVNGQARHDEDARPAALPLFDDRLGAHLFRATRTDLAVPLLNAHLGRDDSSAPIKILKYKPRRRCVIEYDFGSIRVIGKVFKDERGANYFALQRDLWSNGFGTNAADGVTIPEPLAYIPEMRMFVQERAPGQTLEELVRAADFSAHVRASAAAIAKLHADSVHPPKQYTLDDEVAQLVHLGEEIAALRPERARTNAAQVAAFHAWAGKLPPAEIAPTHRDFYYSQLLFADQRVTLIDWDLFARADPAMDVANFIAHLRFLSLQNFGDAYQLDDAAKIFLDEYLHRAKPNAAAFLARVKFYEAATYFRLQRVILTRPLWSPYLIPMETLTEQHLANQP